MMLIAKLRRQLRRQRVIIALLISLTAAVSIGLMANDVLGLSKLVAALIAVALFFLLTAIYYRSGSFSLPPSEVIVRYLDRHYPQVEDSSGLYLKSELNRLEKLQINRINNKLSQSGLDFKLPKKQLIRSVLMSVSLVSIAYLVTITTSSISGTDERFGDVTQQIAAESGNLTSGNDPVIQSVQVVVDPPEYTNLETKVVNSGIVTAATMSALSWTINISGDVNDAALIFNDRDTVELTSEGDAYKGEITAENRLIYRIAVTSADTTIYSNYYSIEVTEDQPPRFRVSSPVQMRTLLTENKRQTEMNVQVMDDYGIQYISLYTTLARGSGESVRFREQRMAFDRISGMGTRQAEASIMLNADSLGMTPGDELYIYAAASDNHPNTQSGRSDTYIIVVEDTTRAQPLMAGNIVIDLMPEDFRSQRQIIVDTEELLSEKGQMSEEYFKVRSRRIGRDQEMLMLDFGQYMSMEDESESAGGDITEAADDHAGHDHGHEEGGEGVTEAELDGEGQEATQSTAASIIPEEFFHDHGSPEMNTLFAESPRALLRRALSEMFRASQYLQTDRPEEALAYEYRALEYLQEAQQADRRYVRRAGLDGIPIPEDEKRLTGEIDDFANPEFSYRSDRRMPPLVLFEQQIRDEQNLSEDELQKHIEEIQKANITESDKLYLLNRVGRLNSTDYNGAVRQQLLAKLSEINRNRQRNLSPERVPVLKTSGGNK